MERFFRIFGRIFDEYGLILVGAFIAIIGLLALVAFMRRREAGPKKPKPAKQKKGKATAEIDEAAMADLPEIDMAATDGGAIPLSVDDMPMEPAAAGATMEIDVGDALADISAAEQMPDQLDEKLAHQFDMDDAMDGAGVNELDDITIPKVGEAPPPRKSRFFSASWLHRDHSDDKAPEVYEDRKVMAENKKKRDSAAECARLAEIERNMLALRELYEAGLIAPEVYALKAREFAAQVK